MVFPKQIDPERVRYQLDLLVAAIWGTAEDEVRAELKAAERAETAPASQPKLAT